MAARPVPGRPRPGQAREERRGRFAGPLLFTTAWVVSSLRQAGATRPAGVQLSGLAAEDAWDPQTVMAAFMVLGACSIGFGAVLHRGPGT